ncbi:DNA recombination protein RmuC [Roseitranquillus sediminis]|uniref:DNA recombination protein RmuC n=1 Tax=Roseitranquillus sediminis TaxID=2809051 RepID=UPI001D0C8A3F|nr:DNA recombination protein RmuC [Roseitranquillus sediminis]MBM9593125.1 DNA recombination protein RmuC [Roseitranquillus sediminis]
MIFDPATAAAAAFMMVTAVAVALLVADRRTGARREQETRDLRRSLDEANRLAERQAVQLEDRDKRLERLGSDLTSLRQKHDAAAAEHGLKVAEASRLTEAVDRLERTAEVARSEMADLIDRHRKLQEEHGRLQSAHAALQADTDGKLASAEREVGVLKELREEMSRRFEELANATLRRTGADFSKAHTEKLNELLTPFREHVGRFEEELRKVHGAADQERARLSQQIIMLTTQSESIRSEAANLTRALKGDKQRQGAWGEMILERILEASGLERGTHYVVQESRRDEEGGRWRPDVVVKMPRDKSLVIDSKVSLISYEAAVNAEREEERAAHLREHAAAVRRHIDQLAAKGYHALDAGTVDYVLMFMPIEGALSAALNEVGDLTAYAVSRGVGVMTPSTLMVTLRTVDHIWTVERRESNAEDIAVRAGRLYDKVVGFVTDLDKVGGALASAVRAHEDAMGKLATGRGNVLGQIEKLKVMGARTNKSIPVDFDRQEDEELEEGPARLALASTD